MYFFIFQYIEKLSVVLRELYPRRQFYLIFRGTGIRYALRSELSRTLSPTLIAHYQTQLPDKKPIQAKLHELYTLSIEAQEMPS